MERTNYDDMNKKIIFASANISDGDSVGANLRSVFSSFELRTQMN